MDRMTLAEIMDKSIDILRKYIKTITLFALGYGIVSFIIIIAMVVAWIFVFALSSPFYYDGASEIIVAGSILFVTVFSITLTYHIGIIKVASQEFLEARVYASEAVGASLKSLFKVFGIVIIAFLIFIPVGAAFGGAGYFLYKALDVTLFPYVFRKDEIFLLILAFVTVLAAAFSVAAYTTWFIFSLHALTIEKRGIVDSIKRSFWLVKKDFWRIFGAFVLFGLTVYAISSSIFSFFGILAGIIYFIMSFLNVQQDYTIFITMALSFFEWPFRILTWLVISPIGSIMVTLLYFNQRFKKEGFDMLLKLRKIQSEEERKRASEASTYNDPV